MPSEIVGAWPSPPNPTQAHVVEQARHCISHSGGAEVSLTEISRSAHHSPSTLIYQFGSYAGLKDSIFVDITLDLAARVQSVMSGGDSDAGEAAGITDGDQASNKVIDLVAAELVIWTAEEPQSAEFVVRQSPNDLRSAVSERSSEPLRVLAQALVPSVGASSEAIDRVVPVLHQAMNMAIRFAQASSDPAVVSTFLEQTLRTADAAAGLLNS